MSLSTYLRLTVWEILLVCVAAIALTYTMLDSFYISPTLQYSPWPGVIAAFIVVALFLAAFNKRSARIGGALIAVLCLGGILVSVALSPENFMYDTEDTYFFFTVVCIIVPLLTFALSRSRVGTALLFALGCFICAWMQFFYAFDELVWTIVFIVAGAMIIIFKNYQLAARTATSVRSLSFSAGFGVSAGAVALAAGIACVIWFAVIAPLDPGALEIKLITEYRALETYEVIGTSSVEMTPNMDLTSDDTNDEERTTDDVLEAENGRAITVPPGTGQDSQEEETGSFSGVDISSVFQAFDVTTYDEPLDYWPLLLLLLIPIAIVGYFVGRRVYRTRRLKNIQQLPYDEQVETLYLFFVKKLRRVGYDVPEGVTLIEFARNNEATLAAFRECSGIGFDELTAVYVGVTYGKRPALASEALLFARFYEGFWKAARKKLGNVKYFFKSFRL